jgi:histidyl-tRNA synthetase
MTNLIPSLKGTRDFYPKEMAIRTWLYNNMRQISEAFGYQEYDGPFLESIDLYAAKSGEELVKEQSFVFPDRGGDLITLRPELTPSLVRMVAQRQKQLVFPLRWWSFGPFWRYERPQKGRSREFFQWNVDLIGTATPEGDAEMAAIMATFFQKSGLTPQEVVILVNNRRLIESELEDLEISGELRQAVFRVIDRKDKMALSEWEAYALEIGLIPKQIDGLVAILGNKDLWRKSAELERFFAAAEALGVSDYTRFAPEIVRGLDYYTGTVFEAQDQVGEVRRAILGGGRYDNLMADVGGDPLPGVGFAMGDMVITLVLESLGRLPEDLEKSPAQILVTVFDEGTLFSSLSFAAELRRAGLKVVCYPQEDKLARQFKYADRLGIRIAAVLGPEEQASGQVTIKDLSTRAQLTVNTSKAPQIIQETLESSVA